MTDKFTEGKGYEPRELQNPGIIEAFAAGVMAHGQEAVRKKLRKGKTSLYGEMNPNGDQKKAKLSVDDAVEATRRKIAYETALSTALDLTLAVMEATKNTGILNSKTAEVLADGKITQQEAKALQAQFRANAMESFNAADALDSLVRDGNV